MTMKNVAFEHEECGMLCAMASEVAEELDRAQKDQDRLQYEPEFICECIVTASEEFTSKEFTKCWALHSAACEIVNVTSAKLNGAFREVSKSQGDS